MHEQRTADRRPGLTKRYGDVTAVDDLSFNIEPGRVTGFLGLAYAVLLGGWGLRTLRTRDIG